MSQWDLPLGLKRGLDEARAACPPAKDLFTGQDLHRAYLSKDNSVAVLVSSLYVAMNPDVLSEHGVNVVVDMMGAVDLLGKNKGLWGPASRWKEDRKKAKLANEPFIEEYMSIGAKQFYEKQGIAHYLECPAPDDWYFDMKSLMREINAKLKPLLANHGVDGQEVVVLFHCYGGRNRSGAAACGFIWACTNKSKGVEQKGSGSGERTLMADIICQVCAARSGVLEKREMGSHTVPESTVGARAGRHRELEETASRRPVIETPVYCVYVIRPAGLSIRPVL